MTTNPSEYERQDFDWMSQHWHRLQTHGTGLAVGILLGGLALVAVSEAREWERSRMDIDLRNEDSQRPASEGAIPSRRPSNTFIPVAGVAGLGSAIACFVAGLRIFGLRRNRQADPLTAPLEPAPASGSAFPPDSNPEPFHAFGLAATEGILLLDGLRIVGANSAAVVLFGWSEAQLCNRSVLELMDPADRGRAAVHLRSGTESTEEYVAVCRDDSHVLLSVRSRRCWYQGRSIHALCVREAVAARETGLPAPREGDLFSLETERRRIARDIHDELGSTLTSIRLLCDDAALELTSQDPGERLIGREKLRQISSLTESLSTGLEGIVWTVRPENDSLESVASYLCRLAPEMLRIGGIRCRLTVPVLIPARTVPAAQRRSLMLVVKEALHNVVKHSEATTAELVLRMESNELAVEVIDDGCGFDPVECADDGDGLANMRHRIQEAGGSLNLESQPGRGTKLSIRLHLPASEN